MVFSSYSSFKTISCTVSIQLLFRAFSSFSFHFSFCRSILYHNGMNDTVVTEILFPLPAMIIGGYLSNTVNHATLSIDNSVQN